MKDEITEKPKEVDNHEDEEESKVHKESDKSSSIAFEVKDYILNQQGHLSNAESVLWNSTYLNALSENTIKNIYSNFLKEGRDGDNIRDFAEYLTARAPVFPKWKEVYEREFDYDEEIIDYVDVGDGIYAVYVEGFSQVFQYVCSRTGYAHG